MSKSVQRAALCLIVAALPAFAQPQISSAVPAANAVNGLPAGSVYITFDTNLAPATVNAANVKVFGRWSGVASGALSVENGDTIRFDPAGAFSCGE